MRNLAVVTGAVLLALSLAAGLASGIANMHGDYGIAWELSCVSLALVIAGAFLFTMPKPETPAGTRYVPSVMGNSEYRDPPLPEVSAERRLFEFSAALALNAGLLVALAQ